ncbi:MAG: hypothetical protein KA796_04545 [Chryseobacterium sp.]|nr:hypothetical protein [Chryseobacterium sp.]MBP7499120.1 hypothetical protein [Chryseobacterium sp.]
MELIFIKVGNKDIMEMVIFTDKTFLYGLVAFISVILLCNLYSLFFAFRFSHFIPIIIEVTLLFLIFAKYQYIKIILKIWSGVSLIGSSALFIFGGLLKELADGFEYFNFLNYLPKFILLFVGIAIYIGSQKTIIINKDNLQTK